MQQQNKQWSNLNQKRFYYDIFSSEQSKIKKKIFFNFVFNFKIIKS